MNTKSPVAKLQHVLLPSRVPTKRPGSAKKQRSLNTKGKLQALTSCIKIYVVVVIVAALVVVLVVLVAAVAIVVVVIVAVSVVHVVLVVVVVVVAVVTVAIVYFSSG